MPLEFIRDYLAELDATIRALPHDPWTATY